MSSTSSAGSRRPKASVSRNSHEPAAPSSDLTTTTTTPVSMKRRHDNTMSASEVDSDSRPFKHTHRAARVGGGTAMIHSDPVESMATINSLVIGLDNYAPHHPSAVALSVPSVPASPLRTPKPSPASLEGMLQRHKENLTSLRKEWERERQAQQQRELKIKQDTMFEILRHQEQTKKYMEQISRKEHQFKQLHNHHVKHVERMEKNAKDREEKLHKAVNETRLWREDAEHLSNLNKTLEEDLDELRRLENEERSRRNDRLKGKDLPPAYGSLDDEERTAPYHKHATDGGSLEVATFKETIRVNFMTGMVHTQNFMDDCRNSRDPQIRDLGGAAGFRGMTLNLQVAAIAIDEILKHASDVVCKTTIKETDLDPTPPTSTRVARRLKAKDWFVADRCAHLLLDLALRMLAVLEIRPLHIKTTVDEKTECALAWCAIDDTLTGALERLFKGFTGATRLVEMQVYLTRITMLHDRFTKLVAGVQGYLEKSMMWVLDQIEVERQLAAAAAAVGGPSGTAAAAAAATASPAAVPAVAGVVRPCEEARAVEPGLMPVQTLIATLVQSINEDQRSPLTTT